MQQEKKAMWNFPEIIYINCEQYFKSVNDNEDYAISVMAND